MEAPPNFISDLELASRSGQFAIHSQLGWGSGRWYVVRKRDRRIMKEFEAEDIRTALRWVQVWGPMHQ